MHTSPRFRRRGHGFSLQQDDTSEKDLTTHDWTRLFLALPVSWKGTLIQYSGRLNRLYAGKTEVRIYDYVDRKVPMLLRMFEKRLRGYRAMGYVREEDRLRDREQDEAQATKTGPPQFTVSLVIGANDLRGYCRLLQ